MPWLAPYEDAPDSHRLWAEPGMHEAAVRASGYKVEVSAPGSGEQDTTVSDQPADAVSVEDYEQASPGVQDIVDALGLTPRAAKKGGRRA